MMTRTNSHEYRFYIGDATAKSVQRLLADYSPSVTLTLHNATGVWDGTDEPTTVLVATGLTDQDAWHLASTLALVFDQDSVLLTRHADAPNKVPGIYRHYQEWHRVDIENVSAISRDDHTHIHTTGARYRYYPTVNGDRFAWLIDRFGDIARLR